MRWDIRIEGDTTRIGVGAHIEVDGVEIRRVVAFDTEQGLVVARSVDGRCGCRGVRVGEVHLKHVGSISSGARSAKIQAVPCLTTYRGLVKFTPGEGARPTAPILYRKRVAT